MSPVNVQRDRLNYYQKCLRSLKTLMGRLSFGSMPLVSHLKSEFLWTLSPIIPKSLRATPQSCEIIQKIYTSNNMSTQICSSILSITICAHHLLNPVTSTRNFITILKWVDYPLAPCPRCLIPRVSEYHQEVTHQNSCLLSRSNSTSKINTQLKSHQFISCHQPVLDFNYHSYG